jgi:hypothetical protein
MQARAFSTNRPHPSITSPARSRLTTTWPLQPGPLATSVGGYCNQPSSVSGGEAEGSWYVGMANSVHPPEASLASSVPPPSSRERRSSGTTLNYNHICCQYSTGHAPARLPSCRPAVDLQRATPHEGRVLEIDANHPTSPALAAYRTNLPFPSLQTLFCHGGRKQVSIRFCLVHVF